MTGTGAILDLLFCCAFGLIWCQFHAIFVNIGMQYELKLSVLVPPALLFVLNVVLAIRKLMFLCEIWVSFLL